MLKQLFELHEFFVPTHEWTYPTWALHIVIWLLALAVLLSAFLFVARKIRGMIRSGERFEQFMEDYELTPDERVFLDHSAKELGITDKVRMLRDPSLSERVRKWAEEESSRWIELQMILAKINDRDKERRMERSKILPFRGKRRSSRHTV
ncbi:MAG TPA: hypothetical protein PLG59_10695 [bacterium]|nr:hypothetical protein [bacterium]HQO35123.1 hypothetical protein [bacterium]HQQ00054.1 hypothetical protein [bacterium]